MAALLRGGLAPHDFVVLVQVRLGLSGLHALVSLWGLTVSSRIAMNKPVRSFQRTQIFTTPIACLLCVLTLEGCVTGASGMARFRFEAMESRCTGPTIEQLTALPALPVLPGSEDNPDGAIPLSPASSRLATLLGLDRALRDLSTLQRDHAANAGPSSEFLWRNEQIMNRISLASFDVVSTVTELDCEEARSDHVADGLTELRQDKQERGLFLALVGDAFIGVVAGSLSLAGKATAAAANAILGGVLATGIGGAATIFLSVDHEFLHPRNHLAELSEAKEFSPLFPDSVWRYLTTSPDPSEGTIRDELLRRWERDGRLGVPGSEDARRRETLLLGAGGTYDIRDLRVRSEMLNHLKSAVLQMGQDLNALMYELMAVQYPLPAMSEASQ
ncbi:MAG TPA: hypothetical protein VN039_14515 [Nitrospira sp.]|nr:hypothetical protein [Nitrospira sp.]